MQRKCIRNVPGYRRQTVQTAKGGIQYIPCNESQSPKYHPESPCHRDTENLLFYHHYVFTAGISGCRDTENSLFYHRSVFTTVISG
jgi:hypothetical protein